MLKYKSHNWQQDEEVVRKRIAMELLLGDHNEKKSTLEDSAEVAWQTRRYAWSNQDEDGILESHYSILGFLVMYNNTANLVYCFGASLFGYVEELF